MSDEIVRRGKETYLADRLLQEAGDSLMMKLGEAASRLARLEVLAPDGVEWALAIANRNFIIHQYDQINRELTWLTLAVDLPAWHASLASMIQDARTAIDGRSQDKFDRQLPDLNWDWVSNANGDRPSACAS
jgi:uncharacterized protein with HEPN domain